MNIPVERRGLYACLALAAMTLAVYGPVVGFDFVNLDDPLYVYENPHVRSGLTAEGLRWAFTNLDANFWHPLTWLSHMLDWQLFGPNASGHHATGLLLHTANTLMLFLAFSRLTGRIPESAAVAALFALHPLHVESVAWVAERKDVLSTFFFMLTLLAYARYAERRSIGRYLLVAVPCAMGLMAKTMLVTVPFVLLVLDYWPLGRFGQAGRRWAAVRPLVLEKLPLVLLAVPAGLLTILAQGRGAALAGIDLVPMDMRLATAAVGTVTYLWKTLWPVELAVHYPLGPVPAGIAIGAALALCLLTVLAFSASKRYPWLAVGWLWYLGTLAPVSGILQVGSHAMADRYTYIPLVGIFLIAVWGASEGLSRARAVPGGKKAGAIAAFAAAAIMATLVAATGFQLQFWRNSEALFTRALAVTGPNAIADNNLATALLARGAGVEALPHILRAAQLRPEDEEMAYNAGNVLASLRRDDEARAWFERAIGLNPRFALARTNLGALLIRQGRFGEAIAQLETAASLAPDNAVTRLNLAVALARAGRTGEAAARLDEAIQLSPDSLEMRTKAVQAFWTMGLRERALRELEWVRGVNGHLADELAKWMDSQKKVH